MSTFESLKTQLEDLDQGHLLQFWPQLTSEEQENFLKHLESINFKEAVALFQNAKNSANDITDENLMRPVPPSQFESELTCKPQTLKKYETLGYEAISKGEVGVVLMAGGQGTRLGVTYPKGTYPLDLPSGKTLYQLQAERIRRVEELARRHTGKSGKITWYIMTSVHTDWETEDFLKLHKYFGLDPKNVVLFKQALLPCFDFNGKIILERKDHVSLAPMGNGGMYRALNDNGILQDMRQRGVKYIHAHSVDNILIKVADPVFIGYCLDKNSDCGAKVVSKSYPTEPVGVVCLVNDCFQVVEYSEISEKTANLRDEDGNLVYSAGNICNHYFSVDFLQTVVDKFEDKLKLHVAKKKIPFADQAGHTVKPETNNGIKIEKFVFDVFQFSDRCEAPFARQYSKSFFLRFVTWEVPRKSEFSAMKNSDSAGKDCPKTARQDLLSLHREYVLKAGGTILDDTAEIEISPLLSYAGEDLEEKCSGRKFDEKSTVLWADCETTGEIVNGVV